MFADTDSERTGRVLRNVRKRLVGKKHPLTLVIPGHVGLTLARADYHSIKFGMSRHELHCGPVLGPHLPSVPGIGFR